MRIQLLAWGRVCGGVAAVALLVGIGRAQAPAVAFVPVADLLELHDAGPGYLSPAPIRGRRLLLGEHQWLGPEYSTDEGRLPLRADVAPWFLDAPLLNLLGQLLTRNLDSMALVANRELLVRDGTAPVLTTVIDELRQRLPPVVQCDLTLVRIDQDGEHIVLQQVLAAPAGRRSWASVVTESTALVRYEVEIAQGSHLANPVVDRLSHGAMVLVRPFVIGSEPEVWLELLVRAVDDAHLPAIATGRTACGAIDRVGQTIAECGTVVRARLGDKVMQRWRGPAGPTFELRLVPTWQVAPPLRVAGHELEYVPCWTDFRGYRSVPWRELSVSMDEPTPVEDEFRASLEAANVATFDLGAWAAALAWDDGVVPLRTLVHQHHAAHQSVTLRIALTDVAVGAATTEGADARPLGKIELQAVTGSWACATAYDELSILTDWDCEVAQSARIPVPRVERLSTGLFVDVRTDGTAVEIVGELSWHEPIVGREVQLGQPVDVPASAHAQRHGEAVSVSEQGPVHLLEDRVQIETAPAHRVPLRVRLPLRKDAPAVWRTGGDLIAPGRQFVLTVQRVD